MPNNSFLERNEIILLGFKSLGDNVLISRKASFYDVEHIKIGNNVRIDDFCVLSGRISIKDNVHVSTGVSLIAGDAGIEIGNHCCISVKSSVFAITDDFSGDSLVGPMEDYTKRKVLEKKVVIDDYAVVGANCVLLPGAYISKGSAVGALSLVKEKLEPFSIYGGIPCKLIKKRNDKLLKYF